jgi:hypothetical protein
MRWRGKMMSTEHSGVIACHSVSTTRPEADPRKSVPFKAWPEIEDWDRYYLLPSIGGLYIPEVVPNSIRILKEYPASYTFEIIAEFMIRSFPNFETYRSQLLLTMEEYYESNFGTEFNSYNIAQTMLYIMTSFGVLESNSGYDPNKPSSFTEYANIFGFADSFSLSHECGHNFSFQLIRPTITRFRSAWSEIEILLQGTATGSYDNFWLEFNDLNSELKDSLSTSLALEELRANLYGLHFLPPKTRATFIDSIYGRKARVAVKKSVKSFTIFNS